MRETQIGLFLTFGQLFGYRKSKKKKNPSENFQQIFADNCQGKLSSEIDFKQ